MSRSVNEPLTELLSDNSADNDSFFENDAVRSSSKLKSEPKSRGNKMDDLFGIAEEKENGVTESKNAPRIVTQKPSKEDDDDDLGFDPKRPKAVIKKDFFDDLLASPEAKRPATTATASRREDNLKPTMSRQSTESTTDTSFKQTALFQSRPKTSSGRRSSELSTTNNPELLGLFSGTQRDKDTNLPIKSKSSEGFKSHNLTADWLGLNLESSDNSNANKNPERSESPKRQTSQQSIHELKIHESNMDVEEVVETKQNEYRYQQPAEVSAPMDTMLQNVLLMNNMNLEAKGSYTALQQRESQLALASQMQTQERSLLDIKRKQEALILQQEMQFQKLLQQQRERQRQMEENIKSQHERINTHLQLMMSQSTMSNWPPTERDEIGNDIDRDVDSAQLYENRMKLMPQFQIAQLEAELKRLELEKNHLIEHDEIMKTNFEREANIIEGSYKKQIKVLEDHLNTIETRLKSEIEEVTKHYTQKLEDLTLEKQRMRSDYEAEIANLKQEHEEEIRRLRKMQESDLVELRDEHKRMLDTIRQAKLLEFAAVNDSGTYLETLRNASNNLENLSGDLQELRVDMQTKIDRMNKEREKKLELRERRVEDAERRLIIVEQSAEDEKRRLMELVGTLELQLGKLSKEASDENWLLRQKMASIEAEKSSFEREKEFTRAQMARDEKRVAELKEQQLAEAQRVMLELQGERERLYLERTKIETERKLNPGNDIEKQRLEIEATLKVAQDATRQADADRERYQKMQRQMEQLKRELVDKENTLRTKEDELEQEINTFRVSERKAQEAQQKARQAEHTAQQKMLYLQQRMREIGEKEAALAQDRLIVTKERMILQNLKSKLEERKCALCRMTEQTAEIKHYVSNHDSADEAIENAVLESSGAMQLRNIMTHSSNLVDRMMDENIIESYRKMQKITGTVNMDFLTDAVLDDDSKELALNNMDEGIESTRKTTQRTT